MTHETKHTPGPWDVHCDVSEVMEIHQWSDENGERCIAEIPRDEWVDRTPRFTDAEREANARLITASPELLEALRLAVETPGTRKEDWLPQAEAAIAKAEGKQEPCRSIEH